MIVSQENRAGQDGAQAEIHQLLAFYREITDPNIARKYIGLRKLAYQKLSRYEDKRSLGASSLYRDAVVESDESLPSSLAVVEEEEWHSGLHPSNTELSLNRIPLFAIFHDIARESQLNMAAANPNNLAQAKERASDPALSRLTKVFDIAAPREDEWTREEVGEIFSRLRLENYIDFMIRLYSLHNYMDDPSVIKNANREIIASHIRQMVEETDYIKNDNVARNYILSTLDGDDSVSLKSSQVDAAFTGIRAIHLSWAAAQGELSKHMDPDKHELFKQTFVKERRDDQRVAGHRLYSTSLRPVGQVMVGKYVEFSQNAVNSDLTDRVEQAVAIAVFEIMKDAVMAHKGMQQTRWQRIKGFFQGR